MFEFDPLGGAGLNESVVHYHSLDCLGRINSRKQQCATSSLASVIIKNHAQAPPWELVPNFIITFWDTSWKDKQFFSRQQRSIWSPARDTAKGITITSELQKRVRAEDGPSGS